MDLTIGNKYLFDTTVFIHVARNEDSVREIWYQARFWAVSVGYSIITEAELWAGVNEAFGGFRTEQEQREQLKPFTRYFINVTIARRSGQLRQLVNRKHQEQYGGKGKRVTLPDCLIAATAEYYGLTVCSANTRDFNRFSKFGISVLEY